MARTRTITAALNGGEWSPLLDGQVKQDKYYNAAKKLLNFMPTVQGPARRRGGTRYVGVVKNAANKTWLVEFVFSAGQAYILEFGDYYVRFWVNRGQLLSGSAPYEIVSPYAVADLETAEGTFALRTLQSADVMWIVHAEGKYAPYKLSRLGATNWTMAPISFTKGPFRDVDYPANAHAFRISATTGTITVTVTQGAALFTSAHIGMLLRIWSQNPASVTPYQPAMSVTTGQQFRNAGHVYQANNNYTYNSNDTTQRYVPTHTEGDASDGAVSWTYLHSGYGWGTITAVAGDGMSCTVDTVGRFPDSLLTLQSGRWAFSEFGSVYGYPTNVAFYRERLTYARGKKVWHSVVGDYDNFDNLDAGAVTAETAMAVELFADKLDDVRWMAEALALLIGSARSELALSEQTAQAVYSATNVKSTTQTECGGRLLRPLRVGDDVLFVEGPGHRIRAMRYEFSADKYRAEDITVLAEHLFDGSEAIGAADQGQRGILDWAYQQQRDGMVWCVLSDGQLAALTYNRERGVLAWASHSLGGGAVVESVRCIPSPDGLNDDVWFVVRRTVNGATQRAVEYLTDYRLVKKGAAEAVHVDCSVTYRGTATATITGLTHLEGQTVQICADGAAQAERVVGDGQVTLDRAASLVHIGYSYPSRYQSMRIELDTGAGTAQTAKKGISNLWLRLQSTIGGRFGPSFDRMDDLPTVDPYAAVGEPPALFSGDVCTQFPAGLDTDCFICYEQSLPLPATLVALITRLVVND